MARTQRRTATTIADALYAYPARYNFHQAIRLVEAIARERDYAHPERHQFSVGYDSSPKKEIVHFKVDPALKNPTGAITELTHPEFITEKNRYAPVQMQITFMGLTGPNGVLPLHYSELILQQNRARNYAMAEFFNIFDHRAISFFHRAFTKYRVEYHFEQTRRQGQLNDNLTKVLKNVLGLGLHQSAKSARQLPNEHLLYYAGLFTESTKSASGLRKLLSDYFQVPVEIKQFIGSWNKLQDQECTRLPSQKQPQGQFNLLGKNTLLGQRIWYSQGKFRIVVGPLNPSQFKAFLPTTPKLATLKALTQAYVGPALNFDIQLISEPHATAPCQLSSQNPPQLGYFTWLPSTKGRLQHDQLILS